METQTALAASPILALGGAFLAGIASSATPCAISAVPLVVGYVGGYAHGGRFRALLCSLAFALGMAATFTAAGVAVAVAGSFLGVANVWWQGLMAALAIAFGGQLLGLWSLPGLGRPSLLAPLNSRWRGATGAAVAGALAGVAFTPCVTPELAGILAIVGTQDDVAFGTGLMFLYAIGHGALLIAAGSSVGLAHRLAASSLVKASNIVLRLGGGLLVAYGGYLAWGIGGQLVFR